VLLVANVLIIAILKQVVKGGHLILIALSLCCFVHGFGSKQEGQLNSMNTSKLSCHEQCPQFPLCFSFDTQIKLFSAGKRGNKTNPGL